MAEQGVPTPAALRPPAPVSASDPSRFGRVEPDGTVLPCQSYYEGVGNLLTDPWESIWHHPLCERLRKPQLPLDACEACEHLTLCGGGCPLETEHQKLFCREVASGG